MSIQAGALVVIAGFLVALPVAYLSGKSRGRSEAVRASSAAPAFPPGSLGELDAALRDLRAGKSLDAHSALNRLLERYPTAPSLQYAAAVAALQSGYPREAGRLADASVRLGARVADSLALKAACVASADGGAPAEVLLRAAIAADPMNASPFLELAAVLRSQGRTEEARAALESAGLRLMPADSHAVLNTTLAILSLAKEVREAGCQPTGLPERDFPAALAELQAGRFDRAAEILRGCKSALPADLFAYLINDPEFRKYASRPELRGMF